MKNASLVMMIIIKKHYQQTIVFHVMIWKLLSLQLILIITILTINLLVNINLLIVKNVMKLVTEMGRNFKNLAIYLLMIVKLAMMILITINYKEIVNSAIPKNHFQFLEEKVGLTIIPQTLF